MDLNEMKNIWDSEYQKTDFMLHSINDRASLEFSKKTKVFQISEVVGFFIAYFLAAVILYHFYELDSWYLKMCGMILLIYLLIMPLYTISIIRKLRSPDLIESNYKEVLEHFDDTQKKMKQAEMASFIASPFLFISTTIILAKIYTGINVFTISFELLFVIALAFLGATFFNIWAFRKRQKHLQSSVQLLDHYK